MRIQDPFPRSAIRIALVTALLLVATVACRPPETPADPTSASAPGVREADPPLEAGPPDGTGPSLPDREGLTPEQVTQTYYEWYIDTVATHPEGRTDRDGVLDAEGYLHERLVESIVAEREAGLRADPILCAQDVPRSVRVIEGEREGPRAEVLLGTSFEGHRVLVLLEENTRGWQIVEVRCRPGQAGDAPQAATPLPLATVEPGWVEYHNQEYGFSVQIPEDWTIRVLAQDPHMPPIGPPSLKLAVYLAPPQPESAAGTPFSIEFAIGDENELDAMHGEPTSSEPIEIGGLPALRIVEALGDDLSLVRYVVHHPRFPERRVTLLDPVSGFAERRAQAAENLAQFDRVVASFRFVD